MKESKRFHINPAFWFLLPYGALFICFILVPVAMAIALSFTNYDAVSTPSFVGVANYIDLLTKDTIFMQYVLPNTVTYALVVGPLSYVLSFLLAWCLSQIQKVSRTILALLIYSPSMTSGVAMAVVWRILFSGDQQGYLNSFLIGMGWISEPIEFLQSSDFLMPIMILVGLWSSMGVGFLAMLAGMMNIDVTMYEAASIDGIRSRAQEMFYITIPLMKPQMLFGAVMAVVNTFQVGYIGVALSGSNPTPQYAGQLIVNLIEDYGFIRYEMGYASAASVVLLVAVYTMSRAAKKAFHED